MSTPHKHADAIKAWADGAVIQYKFDPLAEWRHAPKPNWDEDVFFRVKPKTLEYRVYLWQPSTSYPATVALAWPDQLEHTPTEQRRGFVRWLSDWQEVEL